MLVKANITFDGQAEAALNFYKEVFNGEIVNLIRFSDAKALGSEMPPIDEKYMNRLVNARLDFGNNKFNVCDAMPGQVVIVGNNILMDVVFFDDKEIRMIFEALSEGGQIIMPLASTYFSPNFGVTTDKFGITWSVMQMTDSHN